jgi:hypothetical protein
MEPTTTPVEGEEVMTPAMPAEETAMPESTEAAA